MDTKAIDKDTSQFPAHLTEESKTKSQRNSIDATYDITSRPTIHDKILPYFKREISFSISSSSIINTFIRSCKKANFIISEQTPTTCTVFYTQRCSFKSIISCCLGKRTKLKISSIRLDIENDFRSHMRTIYAKGLLGNAQIIERLFKNFQRNLESEIQKYENSNYQKIIEEEEEPVVTCKNENYSYYELYKILSSESYSLGKSINDFCNVFTSQYRNPSESSQLLPQPLNSIQSTIESTVETLFTHYNYGKKNTEKVMIYCRPAVEKYIFTKLHNHLIMIYKAKYEILDNLIDIKRKATEGLSPEQIMKYLDINENF